MGGMDVGGLERRARTAGYGDGLLELFAAAVLGLLALGWLTAPGVVGVVAAVTAIYGWRVVERVKERVTYPRVGYHRERSDHQEASGRRMLLFIAGAFLVMALVVLITGDPSDATAWRRAAPLVSGITIAAGFWSAATLSERIRFRVVAAWSVVSGVALWWVGTGADYRTVAWHLLSLAVPLAVIGSVTLVRFLGTHPVRTDVDDG